VGPDYKRPAAAIPENFRAPEPLPAPQAASFANLKWFEVFHDEKLQDLIRTGLAQNYDLRDAATRVEAARSSLGITRSAQFPNFAAGGAVEINRLSRDGTTQLPPAILPHQNRNFGEASLNLWCNSTRLSAAAGNERALFAMRDSRVTTPGIRREFWLGFAVPTERTPRKK